MEFNPYQSPEATGNDEPTHLSPEEAAKFARTVRNIRAICILYLVFGSLFAFASVSAFLPPEPGNRPLSVEHRVILLTMGLTGLAGAVSAFGVLRKKSWGILFCKVLSALYLLSFPLGTILGGYFLLNINKVKNAFSPPE